MYSPCLLVSLSPCLPVSLSSASSFLLPPFLFETVLPKQGVRVSKTCKLFLSAIGKSAISFLLSVWERPGEGFLGIIAVGGLLFYCVASIIFQSNFRPLRSSWPRRTPGRKIGLVSTGAENSAGAFYRTAEGGHSPAGLPAGAMFRNQQALTPKFAARPESCRARSWLSPGFSRSASTSLAP